MKVCIWKRGIQRICNAACLVFQNRCLYVFCCLSLGLISMLLLSLLFLRPFSHFHSRRKLCVRHAAAVPVIGKFSDAALKWFFCLLRAWLSESSFSYSPQEITAADVEIISLPDTSSSQHTLLNSLFPHTVVMCPFKPCRKFGTQGLFALTYSCAYNWECQCLCEGMMDLSVCC